MTPTSQPRFSIVCPVRNAATTIGRTIESVLEQEGSAPASAELVVVDGASTDATVTVVESYRERLAASGVTLTVVSEPDDGIYDAMNKGLTTARGEYVLFLNDDRLTPSALATVSRAIDDYAAAHGTEHPDFVGGAVWLHPGAGSASAPRLLPSHPHILRERFPRAMPACHQAIYARRELLRSLGGFDTRFPIAADYELTVRAHEVGASWVVLNEPLAHFVAGGFSGDSDRLIAEYRDIGLERGANPVRIWARYLRQRLRAAIASW